MLEVCMASYSRPERLPIIKKQLADGTFKDYRLNIWDNTKNNIGSQARFKLVPKTTGNPIVFIDDDLYMEPDFLEYMFKMYNKNPDCLQGWFTRRFPQETYWGSEPYAPEGVEVDYVGTGGMILDRKIFDEEPSLQDIPEDFAKVEDLYISYLARKRGMKLLAVDARCHIVVDGRDQYKGLVDYKQVAFTKLRGMGWKLLKDANS